MHLFDTMLHKGRLHCSQCAFAQSVSSQEFSSRLTRSILKHFRRDHRPHVTLLIINDEIAIDDPHYQLGLVVSGGGWGPGRCVWGCCGAPDMCSGETGHIGNTPSGLVKWGNTFWQPLIESNTERNTVCDSCGHMPVCMS